MRVSVSIVSDNAMPRAASNIIDNNTTTSAIPRSPHRSPMEIEVSWCDIELHFQIGNELIGATRRPSFRKQRTRRTAKHRDTRLHTHLHTDTAYTKQIGIESIRCGLVWAPRAICQHPCREDNQ